MPPAAQSSPVVEQVPVDMERLIEFAGGNAANFDELVDLYIKQTTEQIAQLRAGVRGFDDHLVSRVAHSCAGASATCGMLAIVPLLRQVELDGQEGNLEDVARILPAIEREFERIKHHLTTHKPIALAG